MSSNTSKGRGKKGSKFWIQTLVNNGNGAILSKAIQDVDKNIGNIHWLSPLKPEYTELRIQNIPNLNKIDHTFWPNKGPWWDAVGFDEKGCIILVEAKGHIKETETKCTAKNTNSITKIRQSMKDAHTILTTDVQYGIQKNHTFKEDIWFNKYYQLGNRLCFLVKLKEQGINVKLILLNLINDSTHLPTSLDEWNNHYNETFQIMLGSNVCPKHVILVNFDVG